VVNEGDIETVLRDLSDLIRTVPDPDRRMLLFDLFLVRGSDIARDGFLGAAYACRAAGMPANQIAERHGLHHWTVNRWTNEYADRHGLVRLGRQPRVDSAVPIEPQYRAGTRRHGGTPSPDA
jgi:hypothetical protein